MADVIGDSTNFPSPFSVGVEEESNFDCLCSQSWVDQTKPNLERT